MTEHGIPYQARASRGRSRRSSRRSHDLPGSRGKLCTGRRATGEPLEPDTATRNADRPKGEERQLASRMLGKLARPVLRRADGKGPRERHLVSRLSYFGYPFSHPERNSHRGTLCITYPEYEWQENGNERAASDAIFRTDNLSSQYSSK